MNIKMKNFKKINMKTLKNDYCIKMFVSNDELRPSLIEVNLRDGYLYATNTHVLAKIKADLCVKTYKENEKYPDAERLFKKHVSFEEHVIKTDEFLNEMMKIEIVGKEDCSLLGRKYKIEYLDLILKTAIITGTKKIHISNSEKKGFGTVFSVADFEILLMDLFS